MERRVELLERALRSTDRNPGTSSAPVPSNGENSLQTTNVPQTASFEEPTETPQDVSLNLSCSLGAFPASSLQDSSPDQGIPMPDLISSEVISVESAETLFGYFRETLNPYIHHILSERDSLANVRARSSILAAAICTAAAFCTGSVDYKTCFTAFKQEVSAKLFATRHTFDDVRALCIGAFWLTEISSTLNALGRKSIAFTHSCKRLIM